jgi:LPXTG-motif cell wall-anchored protein
MKKTANRFLAALLAFGAGVLIMLAAALLARPTTAANYLLSALGVTLLSIGTVLMLRRRRAK